MGEGVDIEGFRGRRYAHMGRARPFAGRGWKFGGPVAPIIVEDTTIVLPDSYDLDDIAVYARSRGAKYINNYDPSVDDDIAHGFIRGDVWRNSHTNKLYVLVDDAPAFAKWIQAADTSSMVDRITHAAPKGIQARRPKGGFRTFSKSDIAVETDPLSDKVHPVKNTTLINLI
jgi:hypothetical protein